MSSALHASPGGALCCQHQRQASGAATRKAAAARAAVATEPSTIKRTYTLEDGSTLLVTAKGATDDARASIKLEVPSGPLTQVDSLLAHWGATSNRTSGWVLPGLQPDGTRRYKNRALQSPFRREGSGLVLHIEFADPQFTAMEFTLKNDATNQWYKLNDGNFHVDVPESQAHVDPATIVVPEKLVQVQAYLRWERNGKQSYSREKELEEYELARRDLQEELAAGTTLQQIEQRLLGGGGGSTQETNGKARSSNGSATTAPPPPPPPPVLEDVFVPEDLVAVQAYIRWERNGKQNYSPEKQLVRERESGSARV